MGLTTGIKGARPAGLIHRGAKGVETAIDPSGLVYRNSDGVETPIDLELDAAFPGVDPDDLAELETLNPAARAVRTAALLGDARPPARSAAPAPAPAAPAMTAEQTRAEVARLRSEIAAEKAATRKARWAAADARLDAAFGAGRASYGDRAGLPTPAAPDVAARRAEREARHDAAERAGRDSYNRGRKPAAV